MLASLPVSAGVVEDRKANFKASNMSMRMMGAAMGSEDFDTITEEAMKLAAWAEVMPDYFPEGSGPVQVPSPKSGLILSGSRMRPKPFTMPRRI